MDDVTGGDVRGEAARIAPVIPLFGGAATTNAPAPTNAPLPDDGARDVPGASASRRAGGDAHPTLGPSGVGSTSREDVGGDATWRSTWHPGAAEPSATSPDSMGSPSDRHPARGRRAVGRTGLRALPPVDEAAEAGDAPDPEELRGAAEEALLRKLRARSLSVSEARQVLRTHDLPQGEIDDLLDDFLRRRYLDDEELARSLVTSGVERRNQGRVVLARELAKRGLPRDVIDAALSEVPDDDAERALEFARSKARSLSRLDPDTALRRLMGQLARRGYGGSTAASAAKTALREASFGGRPSGVRFVDSD